MIVRQITKRSYFPRTWQCYYMVDAIILIQKTVVSVLHIPPAQHRAPSPSFSSHPPCFITLKSKAWAPKRLLFAQFPCSLLLQPRITESSLLEKGTTPIYVDWAMCRIKFHSYHNLEPRSHGETGRGIQTHPKGIGPRCWALGSYLPVELSPLSLVVFSTLLSKKIVGFLH